MVNLWFLSVRIRDGYLDFVSIALNLNKKVEQSGEWGSAHLMSAFVGEVR
jgi:hypothetical protein